MPLYVKDKNIFEDIIALDYVCITTNAILNTKGHLIMGRGVAKQANIHNPNLKVIFGQQLKERKLENKVYGLLVAENKYIAFQTKIHYKHSSPIDVIKYSTDKLKRLAEKYPNHIFGLPYPGISNGQLTKEVVEPIISTLPDNVIIYEYDQKA